MKDSLTATIMIPEPITSHLPLVDIIDLLANLEHNRKPQDSADWFSHFLMLAPSIDGLKRGSYLYLYGELDIVTITRTIRRIHSTINLILVWELLLL